MLKRSVALAIVLTVAAALYSAPNIWVTLHGKAYHTKRTCIALRTTKEPALIDLTEAQRRGLKPCGICTRGK